ncbi:uncharacterized protein V2V93DRAFT_365652 [Kockiozyma suomiensis]|uniref:uncharacterized protein n=1 Tax=Kockiozyma suomiensis TaxID=1337062 RepID=UPI003343DF45
MSKRARTDQFSDDGTQSSESEPELPTSPKIRHTSSQSSKPIIKCALPPLCSKNPPSFFSTAAYELHYRTQHSLACIECKEIFPSEHFLDLHISENHDPFTETRRDRGQKIYRCFVEDCDKVCSDTRKRRMHLINKHGYPKEFMFSVVNRGIRRGQTSLLNPPRRRTDIDMPDDPAPQIEQTPRSTVVNSLDEEKSESEKSFDKKEDIGEPALDPEFEVLQESMKGLRIVPSKIRFGRGSS